MPANRYMLQVFDDESNLESCDLFETVGSALRRVSRLGTGRYYIMDLNTGERVKDGYAEDECDHSSTYIVEPVKSSTGETWIASGFMQSEGTYCRQCGKRVSD